MAPVRENFSDVNYYRLTQPQDLTKLLGAAKQLLAAIGQLASRE
jgi:hypothetical protein